MILTSEIYPNISTKKEALPKEVENDGTMNVLVSARVHIWDLATGLLSRGDIQKGVNVHTVVLEILKESKSVLDEDNKNDRQ